MRRHDFLRGLHKRLRPRNYLEIGVESGRSLSLSRAPSVAIDPAFNVTWPLWCDVQLVKATSDEFFARQDPIRHLRSGRNPIRNARRGRPLFDYWRGGTTLDLAFIDGMHLFEFGLRDFMNVERHSRWSTVIVLDDMLPHDIHEAARDRHSTTWAGDVFKIVPVLREYRPTLVVIEVDTEETGVVVIIGADPGDTTLREQYDAIIDRWVVPDPQALTIDVLERRGAVDPERLLASDFWSALARKPRHGREGGLAAVRRGLADLLR
jgi:hypothetical protein